jgi:hypothetical protein
VALPLGAQDCQVLEDFSSSRVNTFPSGWTAREDAGKAVYTVIKDGDTVFLRARATGPRSKGNGIEADRQVKWDLHEYPNLRRRWRPRTFPRGADEQSGKDDSVLGVYIGFCPPADMQLCERSVKGQLSMTDRIMLPKLLFSSGAGSLKYIWSERLAKGVEFEGGRKAVRVLESGPSSNREQWTEERIDVAADYRRRFRSEKVLDPIGISVLTDADDTQSTAEGDYADFRICRQ